MRACGQLQLLCIYAARDYLFMLPDLQTRPVQKLPEIEQVHNA